MTCQLICGSIWHSKAVFGSMVYYNRLKKRGLLCVVILINRFMINVFDKMEVTATAIKPFFPVTFNPSRRADYCVHQNTASCVLSISKSIPKLKTTCPNRGQKNPPKSAFCEN